MEGQLKLTIFKIRAFNPFSAMGLVTPCAGELIAI